VPELENRPLRQLVCGGFFACAVDGEGQLWTWGSVIGRDGSNGNLLGRGLDHYRCHHQRVSEAGLVRSLPGRVSYVAASSYSSLALLEDGRAFSWGDCDGLALGHQVKRCHVPQPVELPEAAPGENALVLCRGSLAYTNGAVVTEKGRIFMWGGRLWQNGISDDAASVNDGFPSELTWNLVARDYSCENLVLAHNHAFIIARKIPPRR